MPAWWMLPPGAGRTVIDRIASEATFPVVVKPSRGAASSFTYLVASAGELDSIVADPDNGIGQAAFIVEEFIPGTSREIDSDMADFVSVESVVSHGVISHLAICGKFTLEPPFRGTGGFLPVDLPADEVDDILDVTTRALRALGMTTGCSHTELKLSPRGGPSRRGQRSHRRQHPHLHRREHRRVVAPSGGGRCSRSPLRPTGTPAHAITSPSGSTANLPCGPTSSSTSPAWNSSGKCPVWTRSPCASHSTRPSNWRVGSDRPDLLGHRARHGPSGDVGAAVPHSVHYQDHLQVAAVPGSEVIPAISSGSDRDLEHSPRTWP